MLHGAWLVYVTVTLVSAKKMTKSEGSIYISGIFVRYENRILMTETMGKCGQGGTTKTEGASES